jgi:hypothetical protein
VSNEHNSGTELPQPVPAPRGAFDWLVESHQQSVPMAPLTDDVALQLHGAVPPPVPMVAAGSPALSFDRPNPDAPPAVQHAPPLVAPPAPAPAPSVSTNGPASLALERRGGRVRSGNRPLDWIAFIFAFLAPPIGLLLGIVAVVTGSRSRGYAASIAKAAIGIGAALSVVLGVAYVVESKVASDHAAHQAIVASSARWCTKLRSETGTLTSDTFGWPAPGATIPDSITAIRSYEARWASLAKVAPAGIRADTQKVADAAKTIAASVQSTLTLDDSNNIAQMQNVAATSGIQSWASAYCN